MRLNYLTPIPHEPSIEALNARLNERCLARQNERACRHEQSIGERLIADKALFREFPAAPFEACHKSKREFVQVLRLTEAFAETIVVAAALEAIRLSDARFEGGGMSASASTESPTPAAGVAGSSPAPAQTSDRVARI